MWHECNNFFLRCAVMTPISCTLSPVDYQPILIFLHNILFFQIIIKFRRVFGLYRKSFRKLHAFSGMYPFHKVTALITSQCSLCADKIQNIPTVFKSFLSLCFQVEFKKSVFITEFCFFIGHRMSCQLDFFGIQSRITHHIGQLQKHSLHLNHRESRRFLNPVRHCKTETFI